MTIILSLSHVPGNRKWFQTSAVSKLERKCQEISCSLLYDSHKVFKYCPRYKLPPLTFRPCCVYFRGTLACSRLSRFFSLARPLSFACPQLPRSRNRLGEHKWRSYARALAPYWSTGSILGRGWVCLSFTPSFEGFSLGTILRFPSVPKKTNRFQISVRPGQRAR